MDEDLLQRRIYLIKSAELLEMIFSQYKETCEVLLDYTKTGQENIKYFVKKFIKNILHANIDVQSRTLIAMLLENGVKCIGKLQSHCVKITLLKK